MSTAEQPRDSALHLYPPKAAREAASALIEQARIPHIPDVVLALREELKRPEPNLQAASDLVARDPAITGDLIKAINSPAFNLRTKVTSIPQAATLMGLPRLTHYVTAVAMKRVVDGMDPRVHDVWQDIMEEVETMVAIAEMVPGLSAEETYLFGILHDIGALIFATQSGDYIARWVLYNTVEPRALLDYERTTMGVEHGVVAFMMAARWKLSEALALAMCYHHAPGFPHAPDPRTNKLIAVSKVAGYLLSLSRGIAMLPEIDQNCTEALKVLDISKHDWMYLCAQAESGT